MTNNSLPIRKSTIYSSVIHFWENSWALPFSLALGLRLFLAVWMAVIWFVAEPTYQSLMANRNQYDQLVSPPSSTLLGRLIVDVWLRWDAIRFLYIARDGYYALDPTFYAFFPGYPYLIRGIASLILVNKSLTSLAITAGLISTISFAISLVLLQDYVRAMTGDQKLARWSVFLWSIFPTSFYFYAPYSDSLFICFSISCLLALFKRKWLLCAFFANAAGITRAQGILLIIPIGYVLVTDLWKSRSNVKLEAFLSVLITPLSWALFNMWSRTQKNSNLFDLYSQEWDSALSDPLTVFLHTLQNAARTNSLITISEVFCVLLFGSCLIWMLMQRNKIKLDYSLLFYSLATFGSFLVWDCQRFSGYMSVLRYVLSLFPVYIGFAFIALRLPRLARNTIVILSLLGLVLFSALFVLWVFVG